MARYWALMWSLALRLLALVAVLLLPLGMAVAPAQAQHGPAAMATSMHHDPAPASKADAHGNGSECTMACSAALPALDPAPAQSPRARRSTLEPAAAVTLAGIELETATPPPKLS